MLKKGWWSFVSKVGPCFSLDRYATTNLTLEFVNTFQFDNGIFKFNLLWLELDNKLREAWPYGY